MKSHLLKSTVAAIALFAVSGAAGAADLPPEQSAEIFQDVPLNPFHHWYVRGDIGVGFFDGQGGDEALTIGGGLGYRWSEMFRTDVTLDYTGEYDLNNNVDAEAWTLLANGYIDFNVSDFMTPYVGVGVGYGDVDRSGGAGDDDGFAYAFHAGVAFDITQQTQIDVGYRYRAIDISGPDFDDHAIRAGLRYNF